MVKRFSIETTAGETRVVGDNFEIDDAGNLRILNGRDVKAVFAAGQWISIQVLKGLR